MSVSSDPVVQQWTNFNPTSGEPLANYSFSQPQEIESALMQLQQEQKRFASLPLSERLHGIATLAKSLRKNAQVLALLMAQEMGKPIRQGLAEIEKCAQTCDHYACHGEHLMQSQLMDGHYGETWLVKRPLGVILAVMPWNFPFWQVIRCAVPAWVSGNVILLKHAPSVQGCARWIEELVKGAFSASPLLQRPMSNVQTEQVLADVRVRGLSFTGSTHTGRHLASLAGRFLKRSVLELGGSDPYIVLADADLDLAAQVCVKARFINSGQSCVAAKRFFIERKVFEPFKLKVLKEVQKLRIGDPADEATDLGPMAEDRLRQQLLRQVEDGIAMGAQRVSMDLPLNLPTKGYFVEPMIFEHLTETNALLTEETFGPVMPLFAVDSLEEAIRLANTSAYGLGAAIFTSSAEKAWRTAVEDLEVGMVAINESVQSDCRIPFGGVKDSGWGRELGEQGILEFVNLKTIGIAKNLFWPTF